MASYLINEVSHDNILRRMWNLRSLPNYKIEIFCEFCCVSTKENVIVHHFFCLFGPKLKLDQASVNSNQKGYIKLY